MDQQYKSNLRNLLESMDSVAPLRDSNTYVLIVSLREFDDRREFKALHQEVYKRLKMLVTTRDGEAYDDLFFDEDDLSDRRNKISLHEISKAEFVVQITANEYRIIGMVNEIKLSMLRLIERFLPDLFGHINQARMIHVLDLTRHRPIAIRRIKRLASLDYRPAPQRPVDQPDVATTLIAGPTERSNLLGEKHIQLIQEAFNRIGVASFNEVFIRQQRMAVITAGKPPRPVITEFYCSMRQLRKFLLSDVDLTHSKYYFNHLTALLDRLIMRCLAERSDRVGLNMSINLNVEAIFTEEFELIEQHFLDSLPNLGFEFRCADILENFEEFEVARELIGSRGVTITVDAIMPHMIGLVDLSRLGANMAKIYWRPDAESTLRDRSGEVRRLQSEGIVLALSHVDEVEAIETGNALGIKLFQGFYVDDLATLHKHGGALQFWSELAQMDEAIDDLRHDVMVHGELREEGRIKAAEVQVKRIQDRIARTERSTSSVEHLRALLALKGKLQQAEGLIFETV